MPNADFYPKQGSEINGYSVMDIKAVGGTAIVLVCYDSRTGEKKALKRFFPEKMNNKKFEEKVHAEPALEIKSEHVIKSEYVFVHDGYFHSVMPFIEGLSLRDAIDLQKLDEPRIVYVALCLTKATCDLHDIGILSTDVKPDNAIILPDGRAKLLDITCFEKIGTKAEVSLGTFPYAPSELLNHEVLYETVDVYSIGVVFLEMLIGAEKFAMMSESWSNSITYAFKPDISCIRKTYPRAWKIINKAIEPVAWQRYSNAKEMYDETLNYYSELTGYQKQKNLVLVYSGKEISIQAGRVVIGRNFIEPGNFFISESHAEIEFDGQSKITIRDAKSRNGTAINGKRIDNNWMPLREGDVLELGNVQLRVKVC